MMKSSYKYPTFIWKGLDPSKNKKMGEIEAINVSFASIRLKKEGIKLISIRRKNFLDLFFYSQPITSNDITSFLRNLTMLLKAGIPLSQALFFLSHSVSKNRLLRLIKDIHKKIQEGLSLSDSLSKQTKYFENLDRELIFVGEQSGMLETLLTRIIEQREKKAALKNKIKKALYYPSLVIFCCCLLVYLLFLFVIPHFSDLFASLGGQLPWLTQLIITLASHAVIVGIIMTLVSVGIYFFLSQGYKKSLSVKRHMDHLFLKIPLFGSLSLKYFFVQFTYSLFITTASGISLLHALTLLRSLNKNSVIQQKLSSLTNHIQSGKTLHEALEISGLFPKMMVQMVAIGEEAGKLEEMLENIAKGYITELDQSIDILNQLIEPLIMVIIGLWVGIIIIALYLPIFKLGTVI